MKNDTGGAQKYKPFLFGSASRVAAVERGLHVDVVAVAILVSSQQLPDACSGFAEYARPFGS